MASEAKHLLWLLNGELISGPRLHHKRIVSISELDHE